MFLCDPRQIPLSLCLPLGSTEARSWGRGHVFYYQRKCEWARGEESTEGGRWKARMCFLAGATKFAEGCRIHGNKPPRCWINCLATNSRVEGRNTHWWDPDSGCSEFHPMRCCNSGDICMDMCMLSVLLQELTRKAHTEVELLCGACFWEASQSSWELVVPGAVGQEQKKGEV